tara:strand:- start:213 stop:1082 length:870 start_codon:yes stop_codon:yes gene_type:complete
MNSKIVYTPKDVIKLRKDSNVELPKSTIEILNTIIEQLTKQELKILNIKKQNRSKYKYAKMNNQWRGAEERKKLFASSKTEDSNIENLQKTVNINLNKLSNTNFEEIYMILSDLYSKNENEELIEYSVKHVFNLALKQPFYCSSYIKLCKNLSSKYNDVSDYLLSQSNNYIKLLQTNKMDCEDEINDIIEFKSYMNGYVQFISELHNYEFINDEFIIKFIDLLIENILNKNDIEINTESLHVLLKNIKSVTLMKNISQLSSLNNLQSFSKNNEITPKIRFKIMDISDLF